MSKINDKKSLTFKVNFIIHFLMALLIENILNSVMCFMFLKTCIPFSIQKLKVDGPFQLSLKFQMNQEVDLRKC